MSGWEEHANRSLQSLADAHQRGQIDLQEYRSRRRRVLQGVRERCLQTQPHAPWAAAGPSPAQDHSRPRGRRRWLWLLCGMLAAGLLLCVYVLAGG